MAHRKMVKDEENNISSSLQWEYMQFNNQSAGLVVDFIPCINQIFGNLPSMLDVIIIALI